MNSTSAPIDKWAALQALTEAADEHGLTHRTLGVLKALMTFLPGRDITVGAATVFPSNKTLSHRLNGMPESTLRRHLAILVRAGIVSRHDSPNRKRYARVAGRAALVFGFDLSPINHHWEQLARTAQAAQDRKAQVQLLRAEVGLMRQQLIPFGTSEGLVEEARRMLRRKLDACELKPIVSRLEAALEEAKANQLSASANQNERHIQYDFNIKSAECDETCKTPETDHQAILDAKNIPEPELSVVLKRCQEYRSYYPEPVRTWHDLGGISSKLSVMMGIDVPVFDDATQAMGLRRTCVVVLCILERLSAIKNPGGYLRRLTQTARAGGLDTGPMLAAL